MVAVTAPAAVQRDFAFRMAVFFAGYFLVNGVVQPFFPVWLQARGLSEVEIANCIALPALFRVLLTPVAGIYADRTPSRRFAVLSLMVPSAIVFAFAWPAVGFWPLMLITGTALTLAALASPPSLALALTGVRRLGVDFGRMRMAGTIAFGVANIGAGAALGFLHADATFWLILFSMIVAVACSVVLPATPLDHASETSTAAGAQPAWTVLGNRTFLLLMAASGLTQASHAMLNSFGSIEWQRLGFSSLAIGSLWVTGLIAEAMVFLWSGRVFRRLSPHGLLVLGAVAGVVRWTLFPLQPGFLGYALLQSLHGLTFGANTLGTQQLIARIVPERMTASAQGIYAMFVGLVTAATTSLSGPLYAGFGITGFLFMVPVAGVSLLMFLAFRPPAET